MGWLLAGRTSRVVFGLSVAAVLAAAPSALAGTVPSNFAEYGTTVYGYQDHFDGSSLATGWTAVGATSFTVSDGLLHATLTSHSDPSKLLYTGASYDGVVQNVLARILVKSSGGDSRMGVTASNTSSGLGINAMFRGSESADTVAFLDDYVVHGPQNSFAWSNDTWYWMRLLHSPDKPAGGDPAFNGFNDSFAKVWLADGLTSEPTNYQFSWNHNDGRSGYAGIESTVYSGSLNFDVDYILIQAAQLPQIHVTAVPLPATWALAALGVASLGLVRGLRAAGRRIAGIRDDRAA